VAGRQAAHGRPEGLEVGLAVFQVAGDEQLGQVGRGVGGGEFCRVMGDVARLLQDDAAVVGAAGLGQGLEDEELCVHLRAARVAGLLGAPVPQPAPVSAPGGAVLAEGDRVPCGARLGRARALLAGAGQLHRGGTRQRLHTLPAQLVLVAGESQQPRDRLPVLGALGLLQRVDQLAVGPRQAYVELVGGYEAVARRRVEGLREPACPVLAQPPAAHRGVDNHTEDGGEGDQEEQGFHGVGSPRSGAPPRPEAGEDRSAAGRRRLGRAALTPPYGPLVSLS
jgi:hypothetical protein